MQSVEELGVADAVLIKVGADDLGGEFRRESCSLPVALASIAFFSFSIRCSTCALYFLPPMFNYPIHFITLNCANFLGGSQHPGKAFRFFGLAVSQIAAKVWSRTAVIFFASPEGPAKDTAVDFAQRNLVGALFL
ncbi:MAG: hypothetical protein V8Q84_04195 [Bilophila sp.]